MADFKISELGEANQANSSDFVIINKKNESTKRINASALVSSYGDSAYIQTAEAAGNQVVKSIGELKTRGSLAASTNVRLNYTEGGVTFGNYSLLPNYLKSDTFIGGTAARNTRQLWEFTLTEEQREQLEAGTLEIPYNVQYPGDGSFVRQWWYDQQDAETQALIDSGELDYPTPFASGTFTNTFALGDNTKINLYSNGSAIFKRNVTIEGDIEAPNVSYRINKAKAYYCSPTGNDDTGDGTQSNPWYSPHKAINLLNAYLIEGDGRVRINCAAGDYTFNVPLKLNHPNGDRITIIGADVAGGTKPGGDQLNGGFIVGNTTQSLNDNTQKLRAYFTTRFNFENSNGVVCLQGGGCTLNNVLIAGDGSLSSGVRCGPEGTAADPTNGSVALGGNVAVHNFGGVGIRTINGGSIYCSNVSVTNCAGGGLYIQFGGTIAAFGATLANNGSHGVQINYGGQINLNNSYVQLNEQNGVFIEYNGALSCRDSTVRTNGFHGIYVNWGGSVDARNSNVYTNGINGVYVKGGGVIDAQLVTFQQNVTTDVRCERSGLVNVVGATYATTSPAVNTVGNGNAYISTN